MSDIEPRLRQLVAEHLSVPEDKIAPESAFQEDLGADSWDRIDLSMQVEDEFRIEIGDQEAIDAIGSDGTFGKLVELVAGKVAKLAKVGV